MPTRITAPPPPAERVDAMAGHPGLLDEYRRAWVLTHRTPTKFARRALADFLDNADPGLVELLNPRHPAGLDVEVLDNAADVGPRAAADAARARGTADALAAMGRCQRCGLALDNKLSRSRGIGPDCWAKGHRATIADVTLDDDRFGMLVTGCVPEAVR